MTSSEKFRILLVDDEPRLRQALADYLVKQRYKVVTSEDGDEALKLLKTSSFDLVLTDISMPNMSGIELLKETKRYDENVDVIMISGYLDITYAIQAMRQGAYDFFTKPFNFEKIQLTIERVRERQRLRDDAARYLVLKREQELAMETTLSLARAAEERDSQNTGHGKRTALYAERLAARLCYSEAKLERLVLAGRLHDIGKIGIDDAILNKPGSLTSTEFATMKRHCEIGEYILKPISFFKDISPIVRWHHERYDGTGYPDGLCGEEIPLDARIICIADFFDAITSKRPYRQPETLESALGMVLEQRGKMFDPVLVDVFIPMMREETATVGSGARA